MAQPRDYTRQYNFNDYQATSPSDPLRGSEVDGELNAIKLTLDDLNANIAKIQRDDGKLGNTSVHKDAFDQGALAIINSTFKPRGNWSTATSYAVNDAVNFNGATYVATTAHTSSAAFATDTAASRWILIANAALSGTSSSVDKFEGDGSTTAFTLSNTYASETSFFVFVNGELLNPVDDYTLSGTTLTLYTAPGLPTVAGNENLIVWGSNVVAQASQDAAEAAEANASGFADESQSWASKTNGIVESTDYSSKAWATGGTGVDAGSGSAKDWASKVSGTVGNTTEYSSKYWATQGNVPIVATNISDVNTVAGISANVTTVSGINANVTTVSGISSDVTTVSGISGNVSTVAGISSDVTTAAGDSADIQTVASKSVEIGRLGTADAVSDMNTLGTAAIVADLNILANIPTDISTVSGISANVTTVSGINANVTTVAGISSDVTTVSGINPAVSTVSGIASDVSTVSGINANVTTVAGNNANVTTVAGISSDVTTVSGISANVSTVAGVSTDVSTVSGIASDVSAVSTNNADVTTTAGSIANVNTVASSISDVNTTASNISDVNTVAGEIGVSGVVTIVATAITDVSTVSGDIASVITAANDLNEAVSEIDTVSNSIANVDAVGTNISNVNTVAGNNANVTTVAGNTSNINTVSGNNANITTVAGISGNVTTVAGISSDVTTVAADATDIGTVSTNISNVNAVAGNASNINSVVGNEANINTVAADATDIGAVATDIANVNTVAGSISNVSTVATNINNVNNFFDVYRVGTSDPSTGNDTGDLFYNSSSGVLKVYNATTSAWEQGVTAGSGFLPLSGGVLSGNLTFSGSETVDGRDLSVDGAKLDGIESGATADQTAAEIRTLVESATDSNVFTDADHTKLSGIEAGADVTDTTNVTAAGAAMETGAAFTGNVIFGDSNKAIFGAGSDLQIYHDGSNSIIKDNGTGDLILQGSDQVKIQTITGETMVSTNENNAVVLYYDNAAKLASSSTGISVTGNVTVSGTVDGRDVASDGSKLDGIAAGATNVTNNNQLTNGAGYTTYTANQALNTSSAPTFSNVYNNAWFRNNYANTGLYNTATGAHFMSEATGQWTIMDADSTMQLRFETNSGIYRGSVYADNGNGIGFLDSDGSWAIQHVRDSRTGFYVNGTEYMRIDTNNLTLYHGGLTLSGTGRIQGVDTVSSGTDAANKNYVDTAIASAPGGTAFSAF